ncbi:hypothetical protein L4174_018645 [Photobacterium sp. CCB-ST2H9]|uniref:hypothetical protein n=1 Tax=unclassified Photobacterium TaxID=2628852 RepID=UPI002004815B|nr:hypothetical protein [Photobacterium sp. CCB-ST2H9]UTM60080.1 hypothetical protein L4174_018645 [Photobacterium sp. CCB-ST2H9]
MKLSLIVFVACFAGSACSSQNANIYAQQERYVQQTCYNHSVADNYANNFNVFLSERKKELKVLKPELTTENYRQLDSALNHFADYWKTLNKERDLACERQAACEFMQMKSPEIKLADAEMCDGSEFMYSVSRAKIISFFSDIERLQLQRTDF